MSDGGSPYKPDSMTSNTKAPSKNNTQEISDVRLDYVISLIESAFRASNLDHLNNFVKKDTTRQHIIEFLTSNEGRIMIIWEQSSSKFMIANSILAITSKTSLDVFYVIKASKAAVSNDKYSSELLSGALNRHVLVTISRMMQDVFVPLVSHGGNQNIWPDMVATSISENLQVFLSSLQITLGQTKGETCLPLPPENATYTYRKPFSAVQHATEDEGLEKVHMKDQVHVLESCLITWTKQIKNILKQDPETLLNTRVNHPGPSEENKFWQSKARNLNSIFDQLQSDSIRKVLQYLDVSKSTYNVPFAKLCKEVFHARAEANDNVLFLAPLSPWFEKMEQEVDFTALDALFRPIMHSILLVWKWSRFYNTPPRLVVLVRQICNELIRKAFAYMNGTQLFAFIEADETLKALENLKTTLRVCASFKAVYFDYKAKANTECPQNQWRIQNNALFIRLDAFLERCHDVLELTRTILQFDKLAKIEVGGTKGKTLTTSVHQIFADFQDTVAVIKGVAYDLMDIDAKGFDDDFYEFRSKNKELERRLASVVSQAFDDSKSITSRFKLFDSFDDLLERPIIKNELEKKHTVLIASYSEDLHAVQQIFVEKRENPPIGYNFPPYSGAVAWARGLLDRIAYPMEKLKRLNRTVLEREDSKEVIKMFTNIVASLMEYQSASVKTWAHSIEISSKSKLKLPLLRRENDTGLVFVNFDPALVQLLREVKYFIGLGLDIPEEAMAIYKKAEIFRRQTGNLDLIVDMYNRVHTTLLPVERPLVKSHLDKIDQILARGIRSLNWKSHGIDMFLKDSMTDVHEASALLDAMKRHMHRVQELLESWSHGLLFERRSKPLSATEFEESQVATRNAKYTQIKDGGNEIHRLLKDTLKKLKVSQGSPDWRAYVDFINGIVEDGLTKVVLTSLEYLSAQLDPSNIEAHDLTPLLEIELDLYGKDVVFSPAVGSLPNKRGLKDLAQVWIEAIFHIMSLFKRLDTADGAYLKELLENPQVQKLIADINTSCNTQESICMQYKKDLMKYDYLWTTDLNSMFAKFLGTAWLPSEDNTVQPDRDATDMSGPSLDLEKFDEKIKFYLNIQNEISEAKHSKDICFVRVNSLPIKQALSTWVTKWIYMFTQFLHDRVINQLTWMDGFVSKVLVGLDTEVVSGDTTSLMAVMTHIQEVRKYMTKKKVQFGPLREIVTLMKSHGINLDQSYVGKESAISFLEQAPMRWDNMVNKTFKKKELIAPMQNHAVEAIKLELSVFVKRVTTFRDEFVTKAPFSSDFSGSFEAIATKAFETLKTVEIKLVEMENEAKRLHDQEDMFELSPIQFESLKTCRHECCLLENVWAMYHQNAMTFFTWQAYLWHDVSMESLLDIVRSRTTVMLQCPSKVRDWPIYKRIESDLNHMAATLPLIEILQSSAMRERHWKGLLQVTKPKNYSGWNLSSNELVLHLDELFKLELYRYQNEVQELVEVATRELKIETDLAHIANIWANWSLVVVPYNNGTNVLLASQIDIIIETLEEQQLALQTMAGLGKFVEYFRDKVLYWQKTLGNVESVLKLWFVVQQTWLSLERIFTCSQDIRQQLPQETKRFESIDTTLRELYVEIQGHLGILQACGDPNDREAMLRDTFTELEICQKALNQYLDAKKDMFPRFYFVSNVALLDILSHGNEPMKIQPHLGDCFDGIRVLNFEANSTPLTALSVTSKEGEEVNFPVPFTIASGTPVEVWLNDLLLSMQAMLKSIIHGAMEATAAWGLEVARFAWVMDYPAQLSLLGSQIVWTEETESALEELEGGQEDAVKKYLEVCNSRLDDLIKLVQGEMAKLDRMKVITIITVDVHARDVISTLVAKKVSSALDFTWQSQLRYCYLNPQTTKQVAIRICDYRAIYSYEYIGNCGRLVITPLTDRCYVTMTTALRLYLGGAPAGPAGTGKTETTKDLARGMGLMCYVFNCSDQMNYQTMADIFRGLSQTGAWGCFDEFNRINVEVLSVVATQVKTVLDAISWLAIPANREVDYQGVPAGTPPMKVGAFNFQGKKISLIPTVGFFITMNPGYAGRTELPENLKALFRSCAMIRPDVQPICENMLMSEGFLHARTLAKKFVTLYQLSTELLSKQVHYDWGLRAIKSVLLVAGSLKRSDPASDESTILMRALRDFNLPKLPTRDVPTFMGLLYDLFPSSATTIDSGSSDTSFKTICTSICVQQGLQPEELFVKKVVDFDQLLKVRHSVMLLGPAGSGKTTIWRTLAACLNHNQPKPSFVYETINPKSVSSDELYGYMTLNRDWKDGVLSIVMRSMSKDIAPYSSNQRGKWVVLDGDIDAIWIESMNTVMDDNKVLTLVSNERIPLTESMRMVFEVNSLVNATPATVSRAGILFINDTDIGWMPYVDSWAAKNKDSGFWSALFRKHTDAFFAVLTENKKELVSMVPINPLAIITTLCRLIDGFTAILSDAQKTPDILENVFLFCSLWAFGGALDCEPRDSRRLFSHALKPLFKQSNTKPSSASMMSEDGQSSGSLSIFDLRLNIDTNDFALWSDIVPSCSMTLGEVPFYNIVVPTVESVRLSFLTDLLIPSKSPVMLVGGSGRGKTTIINDCLKHKEDQLIANISLHYYTDAALLQSELETYIEKRSGRIYGPPRQSQLVYFLDDLNMPMVEVYGTQTPLELLRQYMDYGGWYDRSEVGCKKTIQDVQIVSCMNHKAGSFTINPRLQRHFSTFGVLFPTKAECYALFGTVFLHHIQSFSDAVKKIASGIVVASIDLHNDIREHFVPTALKCHYSFNLRDLSFLFQSLVSAKPDTFTTSLRMGRFWLHECSRVFGDRLTSDIELIRFQDLLLEHTKKHLEDDVTELSAQPNLFTKFPRDTNGDGILAYTPNQVTDRAELLCNLKSYLNSYNEGHAVMNLVLFEAAMDHVVRIVRIISTPRGHAMLVGVGGSGKQSLTKLAAFICQYPLFNLCVKSNYGTNELIEDVKDVARRSGVKPGLPLVLIITDSQIIEDQFLIYLNMLLSGSTSLAGLFSVEEIDTILSSLRSDAKVNSIPDAREPMINFFLDRVRANCHVVLAFSPVNSNFRVRIRRFPSLIQCVSIDWFHPWPKDALVSVSSSFLSDIEWQSPAIADNVSHHMAEVHLSVITSSVQFKQTLGRHNYVTPTSFLELIFFYKKLLNSKRKSINELITRLDVGLHTLKKTADDVDQLQKELKSTMKRVDERKKATDALLEQMGKQRNEAQIKQKRADEEREKASQAAETATRIERQAATELEIAQPALKAAQDAVNCLNKASLTELKSMQKPPAGVDKVTTAVLMMLKLETKNFSWDNAKKMMAKVDAFKIALEQYDKDHIPLEVAQRVEPILDDPNFNYEKMKAKSVAAANLCTWVINIMAYHKVYVKVKPLMDALEESRTAKLNADAALESVQAMVREVESQLNELQTSFREATNEKAKVEAEARACQERLGLAERLVSGLASENERWKREVDVLKAGEACLVGDVLLAAAFVSYIGAFDSTFRSQLWKQTWLPDLVTREIPISVRLNNMDEKAATLDPVTTLCDDSAIAQWMNEGLPADRMSIENGCIIASCERWPLLIDPQLQGLNWLRLKEMQRLANESNSTRAIDIKVSNNSSKSDGLSKKDSKGKLMKKKTTGAEVMKKESNKIIGNGSMANASDQRVSSFLVLNTSQKSWRKSLEQGITGGATVLLENLGESIDVMLEPVLMRQIHKKGKSWFVKLSGEDIEYDTKFRLFLHTKLSNPHYHPEIVAHCTLINFIVTERGLEEQLLTQVVKREQPLLETEKQALAQQFNKYKIQLLELENQLLERLANAPEDILSDVPLIESLEATKMTANDVNSAILRGKEAERVINDAREVYRPIAEEGSMIFFIMVLLSKINHMYQYSLEAFLVFFYKAMDAVPAADQTERVMLLRKSVLLTLFTMVSRGLFEQHKFLFLTQLTFSLLKRGSIGELSGYSDDHLRFFLRGPKVVSEENAIEWLSDSQWQMIQALIQLEGFERFSADLVESEARFREWYNSPCPETEKLPLDWRELDKAPFLKLLVLRCLRADRLVIALHQFISGILPNRHQYLNCDAQFNAFQILQDAFEQSSPTAPIYFILSPGTDVVVNVDKLATAFSKRKGAEYLNISLGQGQESIAMMALQEGLSNGHWILLNNVHLMPKWLLDLDKWLNNISASEGVHKEFRVFISSDPSPLIPIGILDKSIKLTNEPPTGLKANVKRALCAFPKAVIDEIEPRTRCILFGLCYFHSIMLERKRFGAQGFNMNYPFSAGDLISSSIVLGNYMENAPTRVPWQDLRYLFGEIMYGGHIVNDIDRLVCNTYLAYFLRDELLDELAMFPYLDESEAADLKMFMAPKLNSTLDRIIEHVDLTLLVDTPHAFGLHPNTEIKFSTESSEALIQGALLLGAFPQSTNSNDGVSSSESMQTTAEGVLQDVLETYRDLRLDVQDLITSGDLNPYQTVLVQECERMNILLEHMTKSLIELDLGFRGDLTMTESMELLQESLYVDQVPASWALVAYSSLRSLTPWLADLERRILQLQEWSSQGTDMPLVIWISGLFNPQSFLTAILQMTAKKSLVELDKLQITTDITKRTLDSLDAPSRDGQFIYGLSLEGARWDISSGVIDTSLPKEMCCPMPIINCRAVISNSVVSSNIFECPVYRTQQRGSTYIFTAQLRSKAPAAKWVLAGAILVMEIV
ncbi:dynein heavy chain [Thraustotheca clavata]|uniref:Dynein heavy chain, cytoplasmic n=1 Tax=Thraustotheca clavata TaxID=74557 RepID=A0A1V9ZV93_9STRA|nr:dynein heavy chain [Thraustotheca clavata]